MKSKNVKIIFGSLICLYLIYSMFLYTAAINATGNNILFTNEASKGKYVFQEYNCISCHQVYGLGGYMGPDLTKVISTAGKGEEYAKAFLKNGTSKMPDFGLSDDELNSLVAYLKFIDLSSEPMENFKIGTIGTIDHVKEF